MQILLEEFYKTDLSVEKYHDRKIVIDQHSYQIIGVSKSGKTQLVKNYLLGLKKSTYLYINCNDIRINLANFNNELVSFCNKNSIKTVVFDNYTPKFSLINVEQLIITTQHPYQFDFLKILHLYPLDYEEFLAYEHKYDSSALNHFFQLGGFAFMHRIAQDERNTSLQQILLATLSPIEFAILELCTKLHAQKLSAFSIYERLKQTRKLSKDKLYQAFQSLSEKNYIHLLEKYNHSRATKKIYLCDIAIKSALSIEKNFGKLFENMVYLELLKSNTEVYYEDNIDFYIPRNHEIILCKPFADERRLFQKLELLEAFIFTHSITKVTVVSMNKEGSIAHPLSKVVIIPFDIWALGD